MDSFAWILYIIIGIAAGFLGGLLGIGGGIVTVPALLWTFYLLNYQSPFLMHLSVGTSLAAMIFTAASSAWAHYLKKGVYWHLFKALAPGAVLGAVLGALFADSLPSGHLKVIFGFCECLLGIYFLLPSTGTGLEGDAKLSHPMLFFFFGIAIGGISTVLGVGGGIITVPILTAFHVPLRNAISTSAAVGFFIALIGAASFLYLGLGAQLFEGTVGYLYLPAFILIGLSSSLAAPLGVKKAYIWPASELKWIFGIVLILVGLSVLY